MNMAIQPVTNTIRHTQTALVLVVDDDLGMRSILQHLLESDTLHVIEASNGHEALALCNRYAFDLILLDAMMPDMDGFTCCRQLCQTQHHSVPILMVTSLADEASITGAFAAGAIDYVTKPINRPVLQQRVQRLIQQSRLMQQVQQMNEDLHHHAQTLHVTIQARTAELQRSLELESTLKHITDRVRDSLNEEAILQTVVQELAQTLNLARCNVALYDAAQRVSRVRCEAITAGHTYQHRTLQMDDHPGIYQSLLQGDAVQFCPLATAFESDQYALFAFPIQNGTVKGDIWLMTAADHLLDDLEVRLVQQVSNQCAIALRQAHLYEAAQAQIQELARLNQLKDDFLSTVSHELRTPLSNIKMATQMLEISLTPLGVLAEADNPIYRYFNILRDAEQREMTLINDLLDLTRLDAETEPLQYTATDLHHYLPHIAEPFLERIRQQQQHLTFQLPDTLPPFTIDQPYFKRLLTELLHNACKYTPAGETITLSAQATSEALELYVSNTGVEIPGIEYDRIFDKFYRIPNHDPWKYGGTGLGLALVKKLTDRLGGSIQVASSAGQTTFSLKFPVSPNCSPLSSES